MITPVEKMDILKSLRILRSDIFDILTKKKIGICNDKEKMGFYLSENIDKDGTIKKGIYKSHRMEIIPLSDPKIKYVVRILNQLDDNTRAYGVLVNTSKFISMMIVRDYEHGLKYNYADSIELKTPVTESVVDNIDELEKERENYNRELLINSVNIISEGSKSIKNIEDLRNAMRYITMDKFDEIFNKQYTNRIERSNARTSTMLLMNLEHTETIITEEGEKFTILNIDNVVYLCLIEMNSMDLVLIPLMNNEKQITKEFATILGLVGRDGALKIKRIKYDENNLIDMSKLKDMCESMKL